MRYDGYLIKCTVGIEKELEVNLNASKNSYQSQQIARMINQKIKGI